jgi:hypothetical protein
VLVCNYLFEFQSAPVQKMYIRLLALDFALELWINFSIWLVFENSVFVAGDDVKNGL